MYTSARSRLTDMGAVHGRAVTYANACRLYDEADKKVTQLRDELHKAEEALRRAGMLRTQTQRELLEEAKLS